MFGDEFAIDSEPASFIGLRSSGDEHAPKSRKSQPEISGPRFTVRSIASREFAPFSHFFICVTKAFHLTGCSMQSLFLRLRVIPSLPVIDTSPIWCIDSEVDFRCGYALDFSRIPSFSLGEFTPVIEFYRRKGSESELYAFALLPLSVQEAVECSGRVLTFLYKNRGVPLVLIASGQPIGTITVTIALGFPEHQQFLNPNTPLPSSQPQPIVTVHAPTPVLLPSSQPQPIVTVAAPTPVLLESSESDLEVEYRRRHRRHSRRKKPKINWMKQATAYGWKPPGYVDPDWKERAREKGWEPPSTTVFSSIAVGCDPISVLNLKDEVVQTVPQQPAVSSVSSSRVTMKPQEDDDEDEVFALIDMLNRQKKQPVPHCSIAPAQTVFSQSAECQLRMQSPSAVFDRTPAKVQSESSDDDLEINASLQQFLDQSTSSHKVAIDVNNEAESDESKSSVIEPLPDLEKLLGAALHSSSDDEEEEKEEESGRGPAPPHREDSDTSSSDDSFAAARVRSKFNLHGRGDPEIERLMQVYIGPGD
jgi:hypothetical protein